MDCFTNQLNGFNFIRFFTERCFRIHFNYSHRTTIVLYDLNSTNQGYRLTKGLTSWNTKVVLQNLCYRHKQNIEYQNTNLLARTFTLRNQLSVKKYIPPKSLTAKIQILQK